MQAHISNFNPILQGKNLIQGDYVRKFIPSLTKIPISLFIHPGK